MVKPDDRNDTPRLGPAGATASAKVGPEAAPLTDLTPRQKVEFDKFNSSGTNLIESLPDGKNKAQLAGLFKVLSRTLEIYHRQLNAKKEPNDANKT